MLESTKVLTVIQRFPSRHLGSAEVEGRMETGQRSLFRLPIGIVALDDFQQFLSQHRAHTGAALGGNGSSPFEERLVYGERDVLLHEMQFQFTRKTRERRFDSLELRNRR
jgi:hypothetical protein